MADQPPSTRQIAALRRKGGDGRRKDTARSSRAGPAARYRAASATCRARICGATRHSQPRLADRRFQRRSPGNRPDFETAPVNADAIKTALDRSRGTPARDELRNARRIPAARIRRPRVSTESPRSGATMRRPGRSVQDFRDHEKRKPRHCPNPARRNSTCISPRQSPQSGGIQTVRTYTRTGDHAGRDGDRAVEPRAPAGEDKGDDIIK